MSKAFATLFSGIGGADLGLSAAGFTPSWAVEWNQGAINILKANHNIPIVIHDDVCNISYSTLPEVDLLWASPVCCNFSRANHKGGESPDDMRSAYAVIAAARRARSSVVIENVPAYKESAAYRAIRENLDMQGFIYQKEFILNAADFGSPSNRTRFYAVFSRDWVPSIAYDDSTTTILNRPVIIEKTRANWFVSLISAVKHWERSSLTANQLKAICDFPKYPHEPFAIERCGWYKSPKIIPASSTFPCLKSHPGHDGKNPKPGYGKVGSYRRQYDFVHECVSYSLTPSLMGLLMGFPLDYDWGIDRAQAVAGIGNAVIPKMAEIITSLTSKMQ